MADNTIDAVDLLLNRIYIANSGSNNVSVIDGSTNSLKTVTDPLAVGPSALAVNLTTNKIYVANSGSNNVTVIDDGSGGLDLLNSRIGK